MAEMLLEDSVLRTDYHTRWQIIAAARKREHISPVAFAIALNLSPYELHLYERGKKEPSEELTHRAEDCLEIEHDFSPLSLPQQVSLDFCNECGVNGCYHCCATGFELDMH